MCRDPKEVESHWSWQCLVRAGAENYFLSGARFYAIGFRNLRAGKNVHLIRIIVH